MGFEKRSVVTSLFCIFFLSTSLAQIKVGDNATSINSRSILEMESTDKAVYFPRLTSAQVAAQSGWQAGMLVYNSDSNCLYQYNGTNWNCLLKSTDANYLDDLNDVKTADNSLFIDNTPSGSLNSANYNLGILDGSLGNLSSGDHNIAIGYNALNDITYASKNLAIGGYTLETNASGTENSAMGYYALQTNSSGSYNTALGVESLKSNSTGSNNTALGKSALYSNTSGLNNASLGHLAAYSNTSGGRNVAIGKSALYSNTSGQENTALGYTAGYGMTYGSYNTAVGSQAYYSNSYSNATALGYGASIGASNSIRLGNSSITHIYAQTTTITSSDARFKTNIDKNEVKGLEFVLKLEPVTYNYDIHKYAKWEEEMLGRKDTQSWPGKYDIEKIRFSGFLAQEVERIAKEINYDFSGVVAPQNKQSTYGLRYAEFVVPLVKSIQELNATLEKQQSIIIELRERIDQLERK